MSRDVQISEDEWTAGIIAELERVPDVVRLRRWSRQEEEILRLYFGRKPTREIARVLGRTFSAVRSKAEHLGLTFGSYDGEL